MYTNALTPQQFQQEDTQMAKLKTASHYLTYSKSPKAFWAKQHVGLKFDPKTQLFIENLAMQLDTLEGVDSERMPGALEDLWVRVHIETELEFANTQQPRPSVHTDYPWLDHWS